MNNLFHMEFKRILRSHIFLLCQVLLVLIGGLASVLYYVYYRGQGDSRYVLLSFYNSYTQFTYLVLGFVFISMFAKDFQNGVYEWFNQLGHDFGRIVTVKLAVLIMTILPLLNIIFIIAQLISGNSDFAYFFKCLLSVNLGVIYIMILALTISMLFKKVIQSTLIMYGLFLAFNGLNLVVCGLMNPSDANSITSYYLCKTINPAHVHYSLNRLSLSHSVLEFVALALPAIWILALSVLTFLLMHRYQKRRRGNA